MNNPYLEADCYELNLRIANCHPLELDWISRLIFAIRISEDYDTVMVLMGELMIHAEPLDTWYLTVAMFLDKKEVDMLQPILEQIVNNEEYFFSEFVVYDMVI